MSKSAPSKARSQRNQETMALVNQFLDFTSKARYINIKHSEEAGGCHDKNGFKRVYNLPNAAYEQDRVFYRNSCQIEAVLTRFEEGGYLREDEKNAVAIFVDDENIPDIRVKDILSIMYRDEKQMFTFRYSDCGQTSYIAVTFHP